jgi:polyphosphate kinase
MYEDLGLFTADPDLGADLSELFNDLTGYSRPQGYRKLLAAPATLRPHIIERIREEAARGPDGRVLFKLNHLADPDIIDKLYAESQAGCRIYLIIRGICGLRAGVAGLSENVRVRSIIGLYLEHSRIYRFGNPDNGTVYYLGSADMMPRNLNGRVEAMSPVTDPSLKARLEEILRVLLEDKSLAWAMSPGGESWQRIGSDSASSAQLRLQDLALERASRAPKRQTG